MHLCFAGDVPVSTHSEGNSFWDPRPRQSPSSHTLGTDRLRRAVHIFPEIPHNLSDCFVSYFILSLIGFKALHWALNPSRIIGQFIAKSYLLLKTSQMLSLFGRWFLTGLTDWLSWYYLKMYISDVPAGIFLPVSTQSMIQYISLSTQAHSSASFSRSCLSFME